MDKDLPIRDAALETQYYSKLYALADSDGDGRVTAKEGAVFFRKSGLGDQMLGQIWSLADAKMNGFLQHREFAVAMRLVTMAQQGKKLDINQIHNVTRLPKFNGVDCPPLIPESMTEQDLLKYDQLFTTADANQDGFVDGGEAKNFFIKSSLDNQKLAQIWKLCERDGDAKLNRTEFRLAMNCVYWCLQGNPVPTFLPPPLIEQARIANVYTPGKVGQKLGGGPSPFIASLQASGTPNVLHTQNITVIHGAPNQDVLNSGSVSYQQHLYHGKPGQSMAPNQQNSVHYSQQQGNKPVATGSQVQPMQPQVLQTQPQQQQSGRSNDPFAFLGDPSPGNATSTTTHQGIMSTSQSQSMGTGQRAQVQTQAQSGNAPLNPLVPHSGSFNPSSQQAKSGTGSSAQQGAFDPFSSLGAQTGQTPVRPRAASGSDSGNAVFNPLSNTITSTTSTPQTSTNAPFDPFSQLGGSTTTLQPQTAQSSQLQGNAKSNQSQPFGSPFGQSTEENIEWIPVEGGHNFDQTKFVEHYALPGASFEVRANFTAELSQALNKVKKTD